MSNDIIIVAVGDLQLGDSSTSVGFGFRSRYPDGPALSRVLAGVRGRLTGDIVFGNLECVLPRIPVDRGSWRRWQMQGDPTFAPALRQAGFTALNVANNHAVQHGRPAFDDTVSLLESSGIGVCGLRGESPWSSRPLRIACPGGLVGLLGYSLRPRQYDQSPPPYAEGRAEALVQDIRRLRSEVDHVVVSLHWGEEFVGEPSRDEVGLANAMTDAGACLILGHHPHVTRPVERRGAAIVAYSLGNFVGDMVWYPPFLRGLLLRCTLRSGAPVAAKAVDTTISRDFHPSISEDAVPLVEALEGLPTPVYQTAIRGTIQAQRRALYRYALRNLPRYPTRLLVQLAGETIGNKLRGLSAQRGGAT